VILATVSSDTGFHKEVRAALDGHNLQFEVYLDLGYGDTVRLRGLNSEQKAIVIIDFADSARAMPAARAVDGHLLIGSIAVNTGGQRDELLLLMQAGVRDVLPRFTSREILQAANRAAAKLGCAGELVADLYAFVPAKPGCGATTVATYATSIAARLANEATLLLDFDIRLGVTSFLLKADGAKNISEALLIADRLDGDLWARLVSQIGNLHLLGSGPIDFAHPIPLQRFTELLDFALRRYSVVSVDLPGSMEDHECEALLRAKKIFLVCTPDIGALHVARRKSDWFRDLRLTDKVSVVLNSTERRTPFSIADIERIIQLPVRYLLPASASEIGKAVQNGALIEGSSPLARQIAKIAGDMTVARPAVKKPNAVRRFVEYFSVSAARDVQGD
jgi:Flp pilus assembly CpaE family ATPase